MSSLWDRYQQYLVRHETLGVALDISRMRFDALGIDDDRLRRHFHALNHLAANDHRVRQQTGGTAGADTFVLA